MCVFVCVCIYIYIYILCTCICMYICSKIKAHQNISKLGFGRWNPLMLCCWLAKEPQERPAGRRPEESEAGPLRQQRWIEKTEKNSRHRMNGLKSKLNPSKTHGLRMVSSVFCMVFHVLHIPGPGGVVSFQLDSTCAGPRCHPTVVQHLPRHLRAAGQGRNSAIFRAAIYPC